MGRELRIDRETVTASSVSPAQQRPLQVAGLGALPIAEGREGRRNCAGRGRWGTGIRFPGRSGVLVGAEVQPSRNDSGINIATRLLNNGAPAKPVQPAPNRCAE
jgi:hypothetical protein